MQGVTVTEYPAIENTICAPEPGGMVNCQYYYFQVFSTSTVISEPPSSEIIIKTASSTELSDVTSVIFMVIMLGVIFTGCTVWVINKFI